MMKRELIVWLAVATLASPLRAEEAPPAKEEVRRLDVMEYIVQGNTVLPSLSIEEALYPYLGESRTVDDIEHARENLEKTYRDAGYLTVLVDIPEQKVDSGMVTLQVTEGKVARTRVVGSHYFSQGRIREKTPELAEGNVPYFPDVQKQIAAVNTTADRRVTPVLKPGKTPGTVEVDLKVEDRFPLHANLELNNRQSANTTPLRLSGMVRYDNLWQREHSLALQYQTAPENPSESQVLSATYTLPMTARGDMLALYAVHSNSDVAVLGSMSVLGKGDIFGVRYIAPLPGQENLFHSLSFGADYKDFKENLNLQGGDSLRTPISYIPLSIAYSATVQTPQAQTQANISANFALRGLGNKPGEFENKRYKAQPNFFYLKGDATHSRKLFDDFSLYAKLSGQIASMPLVSNEQFGAGGVESVRGYLESAALGDNALQGTLEIRSPSLADKLPDGVDDLRVLAFVEGAALRVKDPLPEQISRFTLSSAGVGLRLRAARNMSATIDVGWPFKRTANNQSGEARTHFKMLYEF